MSSQLNILALASKNTGDPFIIRARERGARVWLLTKESYLYRNRWRRDLIEDVFAEPDNAPLTHTLNAVTFLARTVRFDRVVPFGDLEVDVAAHLREHLCLPGMSAALARVFRDKLVMRIYARNAGIPVPEFIGVIHHDALRAFTERIPPPWMLKPRTDAASAGIRKISDACELWSVVHALGDRASHFLLERYLPGEVHHVDAIVSEGKAVFAEVHQNGVAPFDVSHEGGVFSTFTLQRGSADWHALETLNEKVLRALGLVRGTAHVEYIKGRDGVFYFLEAGARVGGAQVGDLVEAASGVSLWAEWADIEIDQESIPYTLPQRRLEYAALVQSLARTEQPDLSGYTDPEVVGRMHVPYHAGVVLRSASHSRIQELVHTYCRRFAEDFLAVMPQAIRTM